MLRFIKQSGDRWFLREALSTAKDSYFSQRSEDEQWEMIQALAAHGNLPAINLFFCGIANASSLWTNEHKMRVQAEAVRVLGRHHSEDGLHTLKKLSRKMVGNKTLRDASRSVLLPTIFRESFLRVWSPSSEWCRPKTRTASACTRILCSLVQRDEALAMPQKNRLMAGRLPCAASA